MRAPLLGHVSAIGDTTLAGKRMESLLDRLDVRVAGDLQADVRVTELGLFDGAADYLEPHQCGSERGPSILSELV